MKSIVVTEGLILRNCAFSHTMAYSHVIKRINYICMDYFFCYHFYAK